VLLKMMRLSKLTKINSFIHSESIHSCEVCKKVFKNEIQMKQHMSKYHREKDIKCEECPMMFATKGGLRRHMKNHTAIITLEMDENMYNEEDDSFD
jgi:uncharacterized C2H2 Zn-finger protein